MGEFADAPDEITKEWLTEHCVERARAGYDIWENLEWWRRIHVHKLIPDKLGTLRNNGHMALLKEWHTFFPRFGIEVDLPVIVDRMVHPIDMEAPHLSPEQLLGVYLEDFKWFAASMWNVKNSEQLLSARREIKRMVNVSLMLAGKESILWRGEFGSNWE